MDKRDLVFRDATLNDLPEIVNIYNSTVPTRMVTADTDVVTVERRPHWFKAHNPKNRPLWVIRFEDAEAIVGWVSFQSFYGRPAYDATAEISIYLDRSLKGSGLGKRVLEYAVHKAKSFGTKTLLCFVFAHNEPSLRLFRHFGFEDWGYLPDIAVIDGIERGVRILGRRIA
jgi:L-amino acid N-acyltransferase YncA